MCVCVGMAKSLRRVERMRVGEGGKDLKREILMPPLPITLRHDRFSSGGCGV